MWDWPSEDSKTSAINTGSFSGLMMAEAMFFGASVFIIQIVRVSVLPSKVWSHIATICLHTSRDITSID